MNARASLSSNIILFIGAAIACSIALFWFLQHFFNAQAIFETINNDVFYIASKLNENCSSHYYAFTYNPKTEEGIITFDSNAVCIELRELKKCAQLLCGPENEQKFELDKIVEIVVEKNETVNVSAR